MSNFISGLLRIYYFVRGTLKYCEALPALPHCCYLALLKISRQTCTYLILIENKFTNSIKMALWRTCNSGRCVDVVIVVIVSRIFNLRIQKRLMRQLRWSGFFLLTWLFWKELTKWLIYIAEKFLKFILSWRSLKRDREIIFCI